MRKGKFGILLSYYAVLAFILVILNQTLLCGILFLVALLFEKDEWLGRQTLQALGLSLVVSLFSGVTNIFSSFFSSWFFNFATVFSVISTLVWVAAIVLSIVAIINCLKERDAGIPLLSDIAYKAYGSRKPSYKPPVQQHPYYQQQQQLNYPQQPPYAPQQPNNPQPTYTAPNANNIPQQQFHPQGQNTQSTAQNPQTPVNQAEEPGNDQNPTPPPTQI